MRIPVTFVSAEPEDSPLGCNEQYSGPTVPIGASEPVAAEPAQDEGDRSPAKSWESASELKNGQGLSSEELLEQYQRIKAEFANYKRRTEKEREKDRQRGADEAIKRILPLRHGLAQACETARTHRTSKAIADGIALTLAELDKALDSYGIEPMKVIGAPFDPRIHEAVSAEPSEEGLPAGIVLREVTPGYLKKGELFQPARVVVSR